MEIQENTHIISLIISSALSFDNFEFRWWENDFLQVAINLIL